MAIAKAERLMNLALCLLGTRRPLSKRELRESIEAYLEAGSDDSFNRMFERDKDDLRELGLVIETVENLDGETGYLARRDSNRLPPVQLDAEEAAALGLAARVWQQARLAGAASGALQKLRAAGMPEADNPYEHSAIEPRIPVHEAAFEPLMLACRDRRPVVFDYRKANAVRPETAPRRALGAGVLARPLVPGRLGPRPGRRAGLPAQPHHRQGPLPGRRLHRARARRRHRARDRRELGGGDRDPLRPDPAARRRRLPAALRAPPRCGNSATAGRSWRFRTGTGSTPSSWSSAPTWSCWNRPICGPT